MANISSAYGQEKIYAQTLEGLKSYVKAMARLSELEDEYGMYYTIHGQPETFAENNYKKEEDGKVSVSMPFTGIGRWSFYNNLESFEDWYMKPNRFDGNSVLEAKAEMRKALQAVEKITYDFFDYEEGCGLLYHAVVSLLFEVGNIKAEKIDLWEDYPLTARNRIDIGGEESYILDSSLESLRRFNAAAIDTPEIKRVYLYLKEEPDFLEDLADYLQFSEIAEDYFEDSWGFWEMYGEEIQDFLELWFVRKIQEFLGPSFTTSSIKEIAGMIVGPGFKGVPRNTKEFFDMYSDFIKILGIS